jgi:hypothetical protein
MTRRPPYSRPNLVPPFRLRLRTLEDRLAPATLLHTLLPEVGPQEGAQFGRTVAADTSYQVVGAPFSDVGGMADIGQAFVYDAGTGALLHTLNKPAPAAGALFGYTVAVSGNIVVVGGPDADSRAGSGTCSTPRPAPSSTH